MTSPTDPNGCGCGVCKCGAGKQINRSRHMNKEVPHFHRTDKDCNTYIATADGKLSVIETNAVERLIEEHRQLEMFDFVIQGDLQDGDMTEEPCE